MTTRRSRGWRRRVAAAGVCTGVATVAVGAAGLTGAWAAGAPGSNFGSVSIGATAYGLRAPLYSNSGEDVEAEVPYATSRLTTGGLANAITSVFWPGSTGAAGGDTLKLLTGSCLPPNPANNVPLPPQVGGALPTPPCLATVPALPDTVYQSLNDPYVAEAQTGTGKPTSSQSAPGIVSMTATATAPLVSAETDLLGGSLPATAGSFGATHSTTTIRVTGPNTAVVDAASTVRHITLAGGAVTIAAVRSVAHAVTNGTAATGSTTTTITGMTVNGVPVTLDSGGLHIDGKGTPLPSLGSLNKVLAPLGVSMVLVSPTRKISGASAALFSGDLVVSESNAQYKGSANDTGIVLSIGGAAISASSHLGYPFSFSVAPLSAGTSTGGAGSAGGALPASSATLPGSGATLAAAPQLAGAPTTGTPAAPEVANTALSLPSGLDPLWVALVLIGAALLAGGLGLLPRRVLAAAGAPCPLEGEL